MHDESLSSHVSLPGRRLPSSPTSVATQRPRFEPLLLVLLTVAAFLVRIWGVSRIHFWDEMVYLQNAQVICCGKTNYSELSYRPPLLSLLFAAAFLVWHSVFAACLVTAILNALGPLFLYRAGCLALDRTTASIAALLFAFSPFFVGVFPAGFDSDDTGNSLLTDSPALTLLALALWLLLRALARQHLLRFACAGLALALAVLMRFGSLPSVGILFLLPLAATHRVKALLACGAGFLAAFFPYLLWSRLKYGGFFATLREGWANVEGPAGTSFLHNAPTIFTPLALIGLAIAAGWALWRLARALLRPNRLAFPALDANPIVLEAFLWLWLLADFAFFSNMAHKEPRYILPLAPPLLLLAGSGLTLFRALPGRTLPRTAAALLAACLLLTFRPIRDRLAGPLIDRSIAEEMSASEFLIQSIPPTTTLHMNFNYPAFAFYTSFRIDELPIAGPALYQAIQQIPAGGILVVYRETESGQPTVTWADANPRFQRIREYSGFVMYRCIDPAS